MEQLLPRVKRDITGSIVHSLQEKKSDSKHIKSELEIIKKENPVIAEFISKYSQLSQDKKSCALSGILVYNMLKSQSEADRMNEEFKL